MSQSAYYFPILQVSDILIGLADMFNISIDDGAFKRPDVSWDFAVSLLHKSMLVSWCFIFLSIVMIVVMINFKEKCVCMFFFFYFLA